MYNKNAFTKDYYEGGNISNYTHYQDNPYNKALLDLILKYRQNGRLLEVGCAYGYFLRNAETYFETFGIDMSRHAIVQAKNNTCDTKVLVGSVEHISNIFPRGFMFDVIVALDVLEHLHDPKKTLQELIDHLDIDGCLIFKVPNKECIDFKILSLVNKVEKWHGLMDSTHVSLFELDEWKKILGSIHVDYKLMPHVPTRFLKDITMILCPNKMFLHSIFAPLNQSITFICKRRKLF